jgi:hypothetical protein
MRCSTGCLPRESTVGVGYGLGIARSVPSLVPGGVECDSVLTAPVGLVGDEGMSSDGLVAPGFSGAGVASDVLPVHVGPVGRGDALSDGLWAPRFSGAGSVALPTAVLANFPREDRYGGRSSFSCYDIWFPSAVFACGGGGPHGGMGRHGPRGGVGTAWAGAVDGGAAAGAAAVAAYWSERYLVLGVSHYLCFYLVRLCHVAAHYSVGIRGWGTLGSLGRVLFTIRFEFGLIRSHMSVLLILCVCVLVLRTVQWVVTVCDTPSSWWRVLQLFASSFRASR